MLTHSGYRRSVANCQRLLYNRFQPPTAGSYQEKSSVSHHPPAVKCQLPLVIASCCYLCVVQKVCCNVHHFLHLVSTHPRGNPVLLCGITGLHFEANT